MRVLIINTSERTGGAAIAAHRLMEALRNNGIKAKMLVRDKQTDRISVVQLKKSWWKVWQFIWERVVIWQANHYRPLPKIVLAQERAVLDRFHDSVRHALSQPVDTVQGRHQLAVHNLEESGLSRENINGHKIKAPRIHLLHNFHIFIRVLLLLGKFIAPSLIIRHDLF